ncbi:hypothetical protein ACFFRR_002386 [Megaselia abdita]
MVCVHLSKRMITLKTEKLDSFGQHFYQIIQNRNKIQKSLQNLVHNMRDMLTPLKQPNIFKRLCYVKDAFLDPKSMCFLFLTTVLSKFYSFFSARMLWMAFIVLSIIILQHQVVQQTTEGVGFEP